MKTFAFPFAFALLMASTASAVAAAPAANAAAASGQYRNLFREYLGKSDAEITQRIQGVWRQFTDGDAERERLFYEVPGDMAYVPDVNNHDVRTEGLSYAMMICVQLDEQKRFDQVWRYARTYMRHESGPFRGYFAWHTRFNGEKLDDGPASDGEEWFVMALLFASHRWGDGEGILNYRAEAQSLLRMMLHKSDEPDRGQVRSMFDPVAKQINFVPHGPGAEFTDPSYHLPAFYELWARWADAPADREFLRAATQVSRRLFQQAAHPRTGLMPDYSTFDGQPHTGRWPGHEDFRHDAWRTLSNVALDWSWWAADPWQIEQSNRVLRFLHSQGPKFADLYKLDGTPISTEFNTPGLVAMAATAALAADRSLGEPFVKQLWELRTPTGRYRYYDGLLLMLGLLQVSGNFRVYGPVDAGN